MSSRFPFAVVVCTLVLALSGCGAGEVQTVVKEVEVTRQVEVPVEVPVEVIREVEVPVEVTRVAEVTRVVEREVVVTATPLVQVSDEFFSLEGHGDTVTDNYVLPKCSKAVWSWTSSGNFLIVKLVGTSENTLINGSDGSGQVLQSIGGGVYYFAIENASRSDWTLLGECGD